MGPVVNNLGLHVSSPEVDYSWTPNVHYKYSLPVTWAVSQFSRVFQRVESDELTQ